MSDAQLRRYQIPAGEFDCGGVIVIGSDGYFSAVTDFGNYARAWPSYGPKGIDFREALCRFNIDYLCRKLGAEEYDGKKTESSIMEYLNNRLKDEFENDRAFIETEVHLLDECAMEHELDFHRWCGQTMLADPAEYWCGSFPSDLQNFATQTWPRFVTMLRAEMAAETEASR